MGKNVGLCLYIKHGRILHFARRIYEKRTRNLKYVAKI